MPSQCREHRNDLRSFYTEDAYHHRSAIAKIKFFFYICTNNQIKYVYMNKLIKEFKEFAVKGNAIDMAVGVIVGAAFGKIITSIVNDLIMPPIGWLIGGMNFSDLKIELPPNDALGNKIEAATINYGNFIQIFLDFLIVSFCVFMLVKLINNLKRRIAESKKAEEDAAKDIAAKAEAEKAAAKPEPSNEEKLLIEIRDLLKANVEKK